jgi:hypothetical protein
MAIDDYFTSLLAPFTDPRADTAALVRRFWAVTRPADVGEH